MIDAGMQTLFTLPEGFRPSSNQDAMPVSVVGSLEGGMAYVGVYANGEVKSNLKTSGYLWTTVTLAL